MRSTTLIYKISTSDFYIRIVYACMCVLLLYLWISGMVRLGLIAGMFVVLFGKTEAAARFDEVDLDENGAISFN